MIGVTASDRGHRFRSGSPLTNYPHAPPPSDVLKVTNISYVAQVISIRSKGHQNSDYCQTPTIECLGIPKENAHN